MGCVARTCSGWLRFHGHTSWGPRRTGCYRTRHTRARRQNHTGSRNTGRFGWAGTGHCTCSLYENRYLFFLFTPLDPEHNGRHFADNILKWTGSRTLAAVELADKIFEYISLNEDVWVLVQISLKFVTKSPVDKKSALVQVLMNCHRIGNSSLSESMMIQHTEPIRHIYWSPSHTVLAHRGRMTHVCVGNLTIIV